MVIVELEPGPQCGYAGMYIFIGFPVDILILEGTPQPLDEDVVKESAFPIHVGASSW